MSTKQVTDESVQRRTPLDLGRDWVAFIREEAVLAIGAVPLVLSGFAIVLRALSFSGLAATVVDYWLPVMAIIKSTIVVALAWIALPLSPAFEQLIPVAVQLLIVVAFSFRRFGLTSFFVNAPGKFGWRRTALHYPVHVAAFAVLVVYILTASNIGIGGLREVELPNVAEAGDLLVAAAIIAAVALLLFWHPGANVRVLFVFLVFLAIDWTWAVAQQYLPAPQSPFR